jgi:hypothetical protein
MFAFVQDGEITKYPVSRYDIVEAHPETSFPENLDGCDLSSFGVVIVYTVVRPENGVEGVPTFDGIKWNQTWNIVKPPAPTPIQSMSPAEFAAKLAPFMSKLWAAATQNDMIAGFFATGFTATEITRSASYPALQQLEAGGVLPLGTADNIWPS